MIAVNLDFLDFELNFVNSQTLGRAQIFFIQLFIQKHNLSHLQEIDKFYIVHWFTCKLKNLLKVQSLPNCFFFKNYLLSYI